ncbi:MAG: hypothetical protein AB7T06_27065 [Kofleriaceae bacterium]
MNLDLNPKPKKDNRQLAIGLAIAAAALLIFSAFSRSWVERPGLMGNGVGFGPIGCHDCGMIVGESGNLSNGAFVAAMRTQLGSEAEKLTSSAFAPMGWITFGLSILAGLALLWGAFVTYQNKRPELPISPPSIALLALMVGMITACVFVATKPGGPGFVGVSIGFWAFGAGLVAGIVGAQMIAKLIRPVDPDLLDGAMNPDSY